MLQTKRFTGSDKRFKALQTFTQRNPRALFVIFGVNLVRSETRTNLALLAQEPPRNTRTLLTFIKSDKILSIVPPAIGL